MSAAELRAKLGLPDPFAGFPLAEFQPQFQNQPQERGWVKKVLTAARPKVIVEVGCWKGDTTVQLAAAARELNLNAAVVCVDTWLGSVEHLTGAVRGWDIRPFLHNGYPRLFHQFVANLMHSGVHEACVPIPNTSTNTGRFLVQKGVQADLVYIDASHEEEDVYQDMCQFWRVLRPGGYLLGDDWHAHWYGVICAVNRFAKERNVGLQIDSTQWMIRKPG